MFKWIYKFWFNRCFQESSLRNRKKSSVLHFTMIHICSCFSIWNLVNLPACFQRSEKHITDFAKEWVVKTFRKRPRSGFDRLLNPLVLSLHLNYSLHVEIRRYIKILQTDFCVTMHNQKTSAQSLHSVEYFQRNYVDEGWVQGF